MSEAGKEKNCKAVKAAKWTFLFVTVLVAGTAAWIIFPLDNWLFRVHGWFAARGSDGAALFLLVYIVAVVLLVPGSVLSLGAALLYGFWAVPLILTGATIGASLSFLISRYVAHDTIVSCIKRYRRAEAVMYAVNDGGWKIVGLIRLSPLIPYNVQNYFFGLTNIPFWHYAGATLLGMIPGTIVNVYLGTLGYVAWSNPANSALRWSAYLIGFIVTVAVTWLITRKAREKLAQAGADITSDDERGKKAVPPTR